MTRAVGPTVNGRKTHHRLNIKYLLSKVQKHMIHEITIGRRALIPMRARRRSVVRVGNPTHVVRVGQPNTGGRGGGNNGGRTGAILFVTRGSVIVVNINDDDEPRRRAKRAGVLPVLKTRLARSLTLILVLDDLALLR